MSKDGRMSGSELSRVGVISQIPWKCSETEICTKEVYCWVPSGTTAREGGRIGQREKTDVHCSHTNAPAHLTVSQGALKLGQPFRSVPS